MTTDTILKLVCQYYNLTEEHLKAKTRIRYVVKARQMFYLLVYENLSYVSLVRMSKILNQSHDVAIYGIEKISQEISLYPEMKRDYEYFKETIEGRFMPKNNYTPTGQQICNWCVVPADHPILTYGEA